MKLKEVVDLKQEKAILSKTDKIKYIGLEHIQKETLDINGYGYSNEVISDKYTFKKGDILVGRLRPYFHKVILAPFDGVCSTEIWVFRPKNGYSSNQIFPILASERFITYITNTSTGTRMPRADWNASKRFRVDPNILKNPNGDFSLIGEKIETNKEIAKSLEEYSQLLFYKWFVDFNFPNKEGRPYKDSGGEMKEIAGKIVPIGWERAPIGNFVTINTETINPQEHPNKEFKYFSIPVYDETRTYGYDLGSTIKSNKYKVNDNNILVSKLNPWFNRVIYPMDTGEAICSTEFTVWNPVVSNHLEYLYVLANTTKFTRTCTKASIGTSNSHKRVRPEFMLKYMVPYKRDIVTKFNELIKPIIQKIHLVKMENQLLVETRNLLIKKLIR